MGLEFTYTGANDEILDMLTGSGITVKAASDVVNRKFSEQIGILYSGMELGNLTIYGDENDLMAALPDLKMCIRDRGLPGRGLRKQWRL